MYSTCSTVWWVTVKEVMARWYAGGSAGEWGGSGSSVLCRPPCIRRCSLRRQDFVPLHGSANHGSPLGIRMGSRLVKGSVEVVTGVGALATGQCVDDVTPTGCVAWDPGDGHPSYHEMDSHLLIFFPFFTYLSGTGSW